MGKATSRVIAAVIDYVMSNRELSASLAKRDEDPDAAALEIRARFNRQHPSDPRKARYIVEFIYALKDSSKENYDDIVVWVEVIDEGTLDFSILRVDFH